MKAGLSCRVKGVVGLTLIIKDTRLENLKRLKEMSEKDILVHKGL